MKYIFLFFIISTTVLAKAQQITDTSAVKTNSTVFQADSTEKEVYVDTLGVGFWNKIFAPTYPNPERAAAMSFILPGAGQVYNKKFWYIKVPVIYAGYAFLIERGETNRGRRNEFQAAYEAYSAGEPHQFTGTRLDSELALRTTRDNFDKNFQLSYIGVVILHFVQTLEAYTTAHLLKFDMDESLTISPTLIPSDPMGFGGSKPGITVGIQLGR